MQYFKGNLPQYSIKTTAFITHSKHWIIQLANTVSLEPATTALFGKSARRTFKKKILTCVYAGLGNVLDPSSIQALSFYVDPKLAVNNPGKFSRQIEGVFRDTAGGMYERHASLLIDEICKEIARAFALEEKEWSSLQECLQEARTKFSE
jgi:hypothetical protein